MNTDTLFLIAYDEIALKGKNRSRFIEKLIENISYLTGISDSRIKHRQGRIYLELPEDMDKDSVDDKLRKVFGIRWYTFTEVTDLNYEELREKALERAGKEKALGAESFKLETRRSNKEFHMRSRDINVELGDEIRVSKEMEVDVHHPDVTFFIEVREEHIYLYTNPVEGPGGLPAGSNGKALALVSGGIDSPVAVWNLMKRGLSVDCVYFHSPPYTGEKALKKVQMLMQRLQSWNGAPITLYIPEFTEIQEELVDKVPESIWTIEQRRFMHRIADRIVEEKGYLGVGTGDSVGQVASQTLENLKIISKVSDSLLLRPLTGYDKQQIVDVAKRINTYEISILPYEDCCVMFAPNNPTTRARANRVKQFEEELDIEQLVRNSYSKMSIETYNREEKQEIEIK